MNLRDQLLKSGLASKEQAKKAQREVSKKQHERLATKKDGNASVEVSLGEKTLEAKREADRLLNQKRNDERLLREQVARAQDIIANHNLLENGAPEVYFFRDGLKRIARINVTELQRSLLAKGQLAIASLGPEEKYALLTTENAGKVLEADTRLIVCRHPEEEEEEEENEALL